MQFLNSADFLLNVIQDDTMVTNSYYLVPNRLILIHPSPFTVS